MPAEPGEFRFVEWSSMNNIVIRRIVKTCFQFPQDRFEDLSEFVKNLLLKTFKVTLLSLGEYAGFVRKPTCIGTIGEEVISLENDSGTSGKFLLDQIIKQGSIPGIVV